MMVPVTNLYFIRHGESEEEAQRVIGDLPLTPAGEQQVARLGAYLQRTHALPQIDALVTSPFQRTVGTARRLAPVWGELPVLVEDGLRKWMPQSAIGLPFDDFKRRYGTDPYRPQQGLATEETWAAFLLRVYTTYNALFSLYTGKSIVIVTHRGVMECAHAFIQGMTTLNFPRVHYQMAYTAITHWRHAPDPFSSGWTLVKHNDVSHLEQEAGVHVSRS